MNRVEFSTFEQSIQGSDMPTGIYGHCIIKLNDNEALLTGGRNNSGRTRDTWYFTYDSKTWRQGPSLIEGRSYHGCGKFTIGNTTVLVVAGGFEESLVEFLVLNQPIPEWELGKEFKMNF